MNTTTTKIKTTTTNTAVNNTRKTDYHHLRDEDYTAAATTTTTKKDTPTKNDVYAATCYGNLPPKSDKAAQSKPPFVPLFATACSNRERNTRST